MHHLLKAGDELVPGYRLIEEIESTAFYKVWRVQTPEGQFRSWKIIDLVVGNAAVETRTLGLLVRLNHPNLNTLTSFWNLDDGKTLIVESQLPSDTVRHRMDQCRSSGKQGLPFEEALQYIEQAAQGLDFLNKPQHDYNGQQVAIYHRALRPESLLLFEGESGVVCKVSDFGLSKPVTDESAQHSQGLTHYDYDPPEFFEGQTTPSSDQYSLAIVYTELRTGQIPFRGTMLEQLQSRLSDKPDLSGLPEPEQSIVRKALHRDPASRYKNCLQFVSQLRSNEAPAEVVTGRGSNHRVTDTPGRTNAPGTAVPRPSSNTPLTPGWRSTTTAQSSSATPPSVTPSPLVTPAPGAGLRFHRPGSNQAIPVTSAGPVVPQASAKPSLAEPLAGPTPRKPSTASPDLKSIREHIASTGYRFQDDVTGEKKVPLTWAALILMATVIGSVWLSTHLFAS